MRRRVRVLQFQMTDKEAHNLLGLADPFGRLVQSELDYAIFLLDSEGHVVSWNRGAERLEGYAPAEIIGRHFSVFYPPEAIERRCRSTSSRWPRRPAASRTKAGGCARM